MTAGALDGPTVSATSSAALDVLELRRVPYDVVPDEAGGALHRLTGPDGRRSLLWPAARAGGRTRRATWRGTPVFASYASDAEAASLLAGAGGSWHSDEPLVDADGTPLASVHRSADGSVFLPFDPNEATRTLLREEYVRVVEGSAGHAARDLARRAYYRLRPLVPRRLQMAARRRFTAVQERAEFPRWPVETALDDLGESILTLVQEVVGEPLPSIGWWPVGKEWAVVLTHDVERAGGYALVPTIAGLERRVGLRSAWYFVPERDYEVEDALLDSLRDDGFEIGVHGLHHDGRDLLPGTFEERIGSMRSYAERWGAVGFRAPATQRGWDVISRLGLDHDSSYSDIARYEPQPGGSCSWLPFFVGDVVELPITLPMDHTVFELLGSEDAAIWDEKAAQLRSRRGMVLLLTHPDYLTTGARQGVYEAFLRRVVDAPGAWHALPREVSAWWRRRAESRLRREDGRWVVDGPAAGEAVVELVDRGRPPGGLGAPER